jgi:hypothetical protein
VKKWNKNLSLELIINAACRSNVPISFEDICIAAAYHDVMLKNVFFKTSSNKTLCCAH